jgi:hypothetical protein
MDKKEIHFTAAELYQEYGKSGALDTCFEYIRESTRKKEIMFWEDVMKYIDENFDDDLSFGFGEH